MLFSMKSWVGYRNKQFRGISERRRFYVQEMSVDQQANERDVIHMLKRYETLTSISMKYGASLDKLAAANKSRVNFDLISEGQLLFPCVSGDPQMDSDVASLLALWYCQSTRNRLPDVGREENHHLLESAGTPDKIHQGIVNSSANLLVEKTLTRLSWHRFPPVKAVGYFILLAPLIAFCIGCVSVAFHRRVVRHTQHLSAKESEDHHHRLSKRSRWKSVLADVKEPDTDDSSSRLDHRVNIIMQVTSEEEPRDSSEVSQAYSRVEHDYQRFLAECGVSEYGYWRGGSSE